MLYEDALAKRLRQLKARGFWYMDETRGDINQVGSRLLTQSDDTTVATFVQYRNTIA